MNPNDELFGMAEWKTLSVVHHFKNSLYVFNGNYRDLSEALALYCDAPEGHQLMNINKRHKLDVYFSEILRRNHNYVAAAKSLVDHSRVLFKKLYESTARFPDYQQEIDRRFVTNPLTQFVIVFRHFCQHYRAPEVSAKMSFTQGEPLKSRIILRKEDLLEFDGWTAPAKKFLDHSDMEIDLQKLINDYHTHVTDFYNWFYSRLETIHEPEHRAVETKQIELRAQMLPHFLAMISSSIAMYEENKIGRVHDILSGFFAPDELAVLEPLEGDPAKWMATALSLIKDKVPLPEDMKSSLISLASKASR